MVCRAPYVVPLIGPGRRRGVTVVGVVPRLCVRYISCRSRASACTSSRRTLYRWKTARSACPVTVRATTSGTPAPTRLVTAEWRVSWKTMPLPRP